MHVWIKDPEVQASACLGIVKYSTNGIYIYSLYKVYKLCSLQKNCPVLLKRHVQTLLKQLCCLIVGWH